MSVVIIKRNQSFMVVLPKGKFLPPAIINKMVIYDFRSKGKGQKAIPTIRFKFYVYNEVDNSYTFPDTSRDILESIIKIYPNAIIREDYDNSRYPVGLKSTSGYTPKKDQAKYIKHLVERPDNNNKYLLDLFTGGGKTYISTEALSQIGERYFLLTKAKYINKWKDDVKFYHGVKPEEVYQFRGLESFYAFFQIPEEIRDNIKIFMCSTTTMANLIKAYITGKEKIINPYTLFKDIKVNIMLVDEIHQHFESIYKANIVLNPRLLIGLSATLVTKDNALKKIYYQMFPEARRLSFTYYTPYIDYYLYRYTIRKNQRFKIKRGNYGYSHNLLENSIMKNYNTEIRYKEFIYKLIDRHYIQRRKPGQKAIVFVASIEFATKLTEYLQKQLKDMKVSRYVENDSYENLHGDDLDIIVSSHGSAGTAEDIKGLITVINTVNVDSYPTNVQVFGRLRDVDGVQMQFVQIMDKTIKQHSAYLKSQLTVLRGKPKSIIMNEYYNLI